MWCDISPVMSGSSLFSARGPYTENSGDEGCGKNQKNEKSRVTCTHIKTRYRCFLPDLAGFTILCCAGPGITSNTECISVLFSKSRDAHYRRWCGDCPVKSDNIFSLRYDAFKEGGQLAAGGFGCSCISIRFEAQEKLYRSQLTDIARIKF